MNKSTLTLTALVIAIVLVPCVAPLAQGSRGSEYGVYDQDRLSPSFHANRRAELLSRMKPNSVAVFTAALPKNRANDVDYLYHQDPDFYYLTGHTDPSAALVLSKSPIKLANGQLTHEAMFVQRRDPALEVWTGRRLGLEGAKDVLGFTHTFSIDSLRSFLAPVIAGADTLYYRPAYTQSHYDPVLDSTYPLWDRTVANLRAGAPRVAIADLRKELAAMRMVKLDEELALMRRAIAITNEAHNEILRQVRPGWFEYEIQALGEYVFTKRGAEYTGYPCIVGSGENSVILHYNTNRRQTKPGEFVEMDIGAEYHGYSADVTRSFPVNGRFTPEQRMIYDIVLEAQDSGIAACVMDSSFRAPHYAAVSVIKRGLKRLGIIAHDSLYKKYFMHGTSHYLGLDVHDPGTYGRLEPNVVLTVEPGIYIAEGSECDPKWWNIGCRIEDDILVTRAGPVNLSAASPRTAVEVERMMSGNSRP